jgi:flagellar biosynthesis chaperone FliJ
MIMQTQEFTTVYLCDLKIDDLYSLNKSTIDCANPVRQSIGEMPRLTLARLETDNAAMGEQMNKASKSVLTAQLVEMDIDSDDRFAEVKRNVVTAVKGRDAAKKAAGESFQIFLGPYWDNNTKAMNTQIGVLNDLFTKYNASASLKVQAATLSISDMMTGLETANTAMGALYQTRNEQGAAVEGPSASSLKAAAAKSYDQFCTAVEQAVNFTPSEILIALFNEMDKLRKTYASLAKRKDKEKDANPEPEIN